MLVKATGVLGRCCRYERRSAASPGVSIKSKLRHHEHMAADVEQRQIHLAVGIVKDPQIHYLIAKVIGVGLCVRRRYTKQDQCSAFDLTHDLAVDHYLCRRDPLYDGTH